MCQMSPQSQSDWSVDIEERCWDGLRVLPLNLMLWNGVDATGEEEK